MKAQKPMRKTATGEPGRARTSAKKSPRAAKRRPVRETKRTPVDAPPRVIGIERD